MSTSATHSQKPFRLFRFAVRVIVALAAAVVLLLVVGWAYEKVGERRDLAAFPPPGQLIDVGGHRLHAQVAGTGSPAVVIEHGLGSNSLDWVLVAPEIAKKTTVVTYDRAGLGWSDFAPEPRTSEQMVAELRTLLKALDVTPPYVLVGHSFGGINVRLFYHEHPDEVAGMVLVEASHEDQNERFPHEITELVQSTADQMAVAETLARFGVLRALVAVRGPEVVFPLPRPLPQDILEQDARFLVTPKTLAGFAASARGVDESFAELRAVRGPLGSLPLVVVTAGHSMRKFGFPETFPVDAIDAEWLQMQRELVSLSTEGRQVVSPDSSHDVPLDDPKIVIDAILDVWNAARAHDTENPHASE